MKALICLSGGIDSFVAAVMIKDVQSLEDCNGVFFDYGQKTVDKEYHMALEQARYLGLDNVERIKLPFDFGKGNVLTGKDGEQVSSYVPFRNGIFISLVVSSALKKKKDAIVVGFHLQDEEGFPDCSSGFVWAMQNAIELGTPKNDNIALLAPLLKYRKKEVVQLGLKLQVPFELTYSCYVDNKKPCGKCLSCKQRAEVFDKLDLEDPIL